MATAQLPSCPQHHRAACYSHGQTGLSTTHSLNGRDFKRWSKFYITVVQTHREIIMYEENARDLTAALATTSKSCVHFPGELTRKIRNVRLCSPSSGRCSRGRWLVFYEKPETISRQRSQLLKLMPHADIKKTNKQYPTRDLNTSHPVFTVCVGCTHHCVTDHLSYRGQGWVMMTPHNQQKLDFVTGGLHLTLLFSSLSVIALQYFIFIVYRVPTLILPSNSLSVSYHGIPTSSNNSFQTGS